MTASSSSVEEGTVFAVKKSSSLHLLLCSIALEKDSNCGGAQTFQSWKGQGGGATRNGVETSRQFWTNLFSTHFLEVKPLGSDTRDDMVFYVFRHKDGESPRSRFIPLSNEIKVFRRDSSKQPSLGDLSIDWEQSVYLNLILQQFNYTITCAVCSRTSEKELQILRKVSHKVFATPSRRRMDSKGTHEELTYPNIFFTIDNFEELYADIVVRDSEMVVVELVASDRHDNIQGTLFMGSIRYDALKRVYDSRASLTSRMARHINLSMFSSQHQRVEFVRMRGPESKGYAEMAVSKFRDATDSMTHSDTFEDSPVHRSFHRRRLSDLGQETSWMGRHSASAAGGGSGSTSFTGASVAGASFSGAMRRTDGGGDYGLAPHPPPVAASSRMKKSQSEIENVDILCHEVEAGDLNDEFADADQYNGFFGRSFGQTWHWFKEKRRATSIALNSYLTYVCLPWHRILADVIECRQQPLLTF